MSHVFTVAAKPKPARGLLQHDSGERVKRSLSPARAALAAGGDVGASHAANQHAVQPPKSLFLLGRKGKECD